LWDGFRREVPVQMDEATRRLLNRSMAALADGDRGAYDPVYRTLWPLLVRFITAISGDRMIGEDIAQQAMLKIFARVSTFDRSKEALAWSMTIAINEYRSYRRKLGNLAADRGACLFDEPADRGTPEAIAIRNNLSEAARAVMGQLQPQDLEVVVAALYDGQRPVLAAAVFRKRLQRALAHARLIWKRRYGDDRTG
jgi:DNA-directed RNA polymerase specialized sigma24 family protein